MLETGEWLRAKITAYGTFVDEETKETKRVWVQFKASNADGSEHEIVKWSGSMSSEKSRAYVFRTVSKLGFRGTNLDKISEGVVGGALNHDGEYSVKLKRTDYNGTTNTEVEAVGAPAQQSTIKGSSLNRFAAELLAVQKQMGIKSEPKKDSDAGF
jgi:hypothetical protein